MFRVYGDPSNSKPSPLPEFKIYSDLEAEKMKIKMSALFLIKLLENIL